MGAEVRPAQASPVRQETGDHAPLAHRLRAAAVPVPELLFERARGTLDEALARLEQRLQQSPHGADWQRFLLWDLLKRERGAGHNGRTEVLLSVLLRFRSGYPGLELADFRRVESALENYIFALEAVQLPDFAAAFSGRLEVVAAAVEGLPGTASRSALLGANEALAWLRSHGLSADVAAEAAQQLSHPNLVFRASRELLAAGVDRPVEENAPIVDCILGTRIYGSGTTRGRVVLELVPNSRQGELQALFTGMNDSQTVGYNRSAIIFTRGQTRLWGARRILVDDGGLRAMAVEAEAATRTTITGIDSSRRGVLGRLVRRVASRKASRQKPEAEAIASEHAADRFRERFASQTNQPLARGQQSFQTRFRSPMLRWDLLPQQLAFGTTTGHLLGAVAQEDAGLLAAPQQAPPIEGEPLLAVRLHESFVVNTACRLLAGRTLDREMVERLARDFLGYTTEQVHDMLFKEEGAWTMTFAAGRPVEFSIDQGGFTVTLHGRRFTSGKLGRPTRFDAMDITARYQLEVGERGLRAVRVGELQIVPADHAPGKALGARQIAQVRWVRGKFEKILKPVFERADEGLVLGGNWSQLGELLVQLESAEDGWLCLSWHQAASAPAAATGSRAAAATPPARALAVTVAAIEEAREQQAEEP